MVAPSSVGHPIGRLRNRSQLRLWLLVRDQLNRHAPQYTAPGCVRLCIALTLTLALSFALTTYEADRLTVPIVHQVERDAAGQLQRQRRRELNKAVTKVDRKYVLTGHKDQQPTPEKIWG